MNILILTYTHQIGSTHVLINIARYLKEEGHNVIVAGDGPFLKFATEKNLQTDYLKEIPIDYYREKTDAGNLDYFTKEEIEKNIEDEIALYKKYDINIVFSTLRFSANLSCELYGINNISLTYSVLTNYYALPFIIPETHDLHKYRNIKPLYAMLNRLSGPIKDIIFKGFAKPYNEIAKERNIQTYKNFSSLYEGDYTLLYDVPEFAPIIKAPESFIYLGTVFNDFFEDVPVWYEEVKSRKEKENKKVLYLSMGSSGVLFPVILETLVNYIKDKEIILIANSCDHEVQDKYKEIKNVYLTKYASARKMLELADLSFAHGGRGTLFDSITMDVPLIIIPHQAEQEWNARRAEDLGFAEMVSKVHFSTDEVTMKLDKVFGEYDNYKKNTIKMRKDFGKYDWRKVVDNILNKD